MAQLTDFLPHILPYLPECSQPLATQTISDILIDFCRETGVWQMTLPPINTVANEMAYVVNPPVINTIVGNTLTVTPSATQIHSLVRIWYLTIEIGILNDDSGLVRPEFYNTNFSTADVAAGFPRAGLYDRVTGTLTLNRAPTQSDVAALTIRAAMIPDASATTVPDFLLQDYSFAIAQGVISRIADIPGATFTNPGLAVKADMNYRSAKSRARVRANRGMARAGVAVAFRPF
jgi:hypothetical protein